MLKSQCPNLRVRHGSNVQSLGLAMGLVNVHTPLLRLNPLVMLTLKYNPINVCLYRVPPMVLIFYCGVLKLSLRQSLI